MFATFLTSAIIQSQSTLISQINYARNVWTGRKKEHIYTYNAGLGRRCFFNSSTTYRLTNFWNGNKTWSNNIRK